MGSDALGWPSPADGCSGFFETVGFLNDVISCSTIVASIDLCQAVAHSVLPALQRVSGERFLYFGVGQDLPCFSDLQDVCFTIVSAGSHLGAY